MITLVTIRIRAEAPDLSDEQLKELGGRLYRIAEARSDLLAEIKERGVDVSIREGSIEIILAIISTARSLFDALKTYDDIWSAFDRIWGQAGRTADALAREANAEASAEDVTVFDTKVSLGQIERLHKIQQRFEEGLLDSEDAVQGAIRVLGIREAADAELVQQLEEMFDAEPRGLERLEDLRGLQRPKRAPRLPPVPPIQKDLPGVIEARPPRRRRLRIRRRPGEVAPDVRFDS